MKNGFSSINFHTVTVQRYKGFCRKFGQSYTYTLEHMMDFFDHYQLSPMMEFGEDMLQMESNLKKRINALVAIVKTMEKHQTKPTIALMQLLFEHSPKKAKQPKLVEVGKGETKNSDDFFKSAFEVIELERNHTDLQQKHERTHQDLITLLEKVQVVKSFGKTRLQLEMGIKEFKALQEHHKKQ